METAEHRKAHRTGRHWFILLFFCVLFFPIVGWRIDRSVDLSGVSEAPKAVPQNMETIFDGSYQAYMNAKWEDSFPGKKALIKARNQMLYSLLGISPNKNVVIGKQGYLYEASYINRELQISGPASLKYFEQLGEKLRHLNAMLEDKGKELYVFITPSKAHFCRNYIPSRYAFLSKEENNHYTEYSKLIETLDKNGIAFFDSVRYIEENAPSGILKAPVYYATGIHWSHPWGEACAAAFLRYMNEHGKYDLAEVEVSEYVSEGIVDPATDLYDSLNLIRKAEATWWGAEMRVKKAGNDKPSIFSRGGSFMFESLNELFQVDVFSSSVYFENKYYVTEDEYCTISSFSAYDEMDLRQLLSDKDILVLEVNQKSISGMSWGFIDYIIDHPEMLESV